MKPEDLKLNITIGPSHRLDYQRAIETGDLSAVRALLLSICAPHEQAHIERLLPNELVDA